MHIRRGAGQRTQAVEHQEVHGAQQPQAFIGHDSKLGAVHPVVPRAEEDEIILAKPVEQGCVLLAAKRRCLRCSADAGRKCGYLPAHGGKIGHHGADLTEHRGETHDNGLMPLQRHVVGEGHVDHRFRSRGVGSKCDQ